MLICVRVCVYVFGPKPALYEQSEDLLTGQFKGQSVNLNVEVRLGFR